MDRYKGDRVHHNIFGDGEVTHIFGDGKKIIDPHVAAMEKI